MYRTRHVYGRTFKRTRNLAMLGGLLAAAACSSAPSSEPEPAPEAVGSTSQQLLSTPCSSSNGNLTLTVGDLEIGYVSRISGCTSEPCVQANALDASGNLCKVASSGKMITVTHTGDTNVQKMVFDFTNGLFAMNAPSDAGAGSTLMNVTLFSSSTVTPEVVVIPPVAGGNMAIGTLGLSANTLTSRGGTALDMAMTSSDASYPVHFVFDGGNGPDIFTGDVAGWATMPTGWDSSAHIAAIVGSPTTLALTINGGGGNDILAGGACSAAQCNQLFGGPGNDTFLQPTTLHAEVLNGGDDIDTVDYSARSASVAVTIGASTGISGAVVPSVSAGGGTGYISGDIVTVGTAQGAVVCSGTCGAGNTVALSGAPVLYPNTANDIVITITASGDDTTNVGDSGTDATFTWSLNGGAQSAPITVTSSSPIALGATGLSANFSVGGMFTAGDTYTSLKPAVLVPAQLTVTTVSATVITGLSILTPGSGYVAGHGLSLAGGTGTGGFVDVAAAASADDGDLSGERDTVNADVEIVYGGSGNDILNASAITTTQVVLFGNAGNDMLTGGSLADDLCGGAGNDIFYDNPGNDHIVGGAGLDTANYDSPAATTVCLNGADQAAGKTCATQNGVAGEIDQINLTTVAHACPPASLVIGLSALLGGGTTTEALTSTTSPKVGSAMVADVENVTGSHGAFANTLFCGTLACTAFGGSANDTFQGSTVGGDAMYGMGGADTVTVKVGAGVVAGTVDLTHAGASKVQTVNCNSAAGTLLISSGDVSEDALTSCGYFATP